MKPYIICTIPLESHIIIYGESFGDRNLVHLADEGFRVLGFGFCLYLHTTRIEGHGRGKTCSMVEALSFKALGLASLYKP